MSNRQVLVLFPGAWGNRTTELAQWWMRHVIAHFRVDYKIIVVTYEGKSLDEYVKSVLAQLEAVPDGAVALCYSMGSQIARGVAAQRPSLFRRVALLSGIERIGVRVLVFLQALTFMLIPTLRTLVGRPLILDTTQQVKRLFFRPLNTRSPHERSERERIERGCVSTARDLLEHRFIPEPAWAMIQLFLPGLRMRFPPFPCQVLAVVPRNDFILPRVTYPDEQVKIVIARGDHALILREYETRNCCTHIDRWFHNH